MPLSDAMTLDEFLALEPEEVGLRLLPVLAAWSSRDQLDRAAILTLATAGFEQNQEVAIAAREALAWLEGAALILAPHNYSGPTLARVLSRKAKRLAAEVSPSAAYRARSLPKEILHPKLREDVWQLYHRRRYDLAVFEAMKAVEIAVRDAARLPNEELGMALMRKAFNVERGPLSDMREPAGERDALNALFAGAIGYFKNPLSHRVVGMEDADAAAEVILLANLLLRIVSGRPTIDDGASAGAI